MFTVFYFLIKIILLQYHMIHVQEGGSFHGPERENILELQQSQYSVSPAIYQAQA